MKELIWTRTGLAVEQAFRFVSEQTPSLDDVIPPEEAKTVFDARAIGAVNALIIMYVFSVRLICLAPLMFIIYLCKKMETLVIEDEIRNGVPEDERHAPSILGREALDDE